MTPAGRAAQHEREFGKQAVGYDKALTLAPTAAAKAALKAGTIELLPTDEEIPTGEASRDAWIFSVSTDLQGDHGLWASVDRKTGDVSVTNFN